MVHREESEGNLKGILGYTEDDVVSSDFENDNRYIYILKKHIHILYIYAYDFGRV